MKTLLKNAPMNYIEEDYWDDDENESTYYDESFLSPDIDLNSSILDLESGQTEVSYVGIDHDADFEDIDDKLIPKFFYTTLGYVDLSNLHLLYESFEYENMVNANCIGSVFDSCSFSNANLDGSSFDSTRFSYSKFLNCCFREASFKDTKFYNCSFKGADLSGAIFVDCTIQDCDWDGACFDNRTSLPFSLEVAAGLGMIFEDHRNNKRKV